MEGSPQNQDWLRYNIEPLPFRGVNQAAEIKLTWTDFDQDESGQNVFLYRGLDNVDRQGVVGFAGKPTTIPNKEDATKLTAEEKLGLAKDATNFFGGGEGRVLHTTRNKNIAKGIAQKGVLVTYKIPKKWLVEENNRPVMGNVGEAELDFVDGLPEEFVDNIEQFGPDIETIHVAKLAPNPEINDVFELSDIPPPTEKDEKGFI
ncbi:MAG: hypothetical protein WC640_03275 [Candidatus Paceibacterota bacterium]|jgi:hypothetical protein